jgi:ketosteroid isomerase-like protein
MSQENVEIVRQQFGATNDGDFGRVMRSWADDIVLVVPTDLSLEGGIFEGKETVGQWFGEWFRSFERGYRFTVEEARDLGDAVLVVAEHDGRGRASGVAVQTRLAYLYRVRDGEIVRIEVHRGGADALEAAGLAERAMSDANVDALRRLYGEWAKGNLWALGDIADPGIEWEWSPSLASVSGGPRVYRGLDEIGAATLEWLSAWDRYWMTADDFIEVGEQIVVPMCLHARAASTERTLEQRAAAVWTIRDGRALRVKYYDDPAEALRDADDGR